jgi:hypothetical protein
LSDVVRERTTRSARMGKIIFFSCAKWSIILNKPLSIWRVINPSQARAIGTSGEAGENFLKIL